MYNEPTESEPTLYKNPYETPYYEAYYGRIPTPPPPPKHYSTRERVLGIALVLFFTLLILLFGIIVFMGVHNAIPPTSAPT